MTLEESIESERLRRERDEEELQRIIDQNVHEVELAKLQKEKEERQEERKKKQKPEPPVQTFFFEIFPSSCILSYLPSICSLRVYVI